MENNGKLISRGNICNVYLSEDEKNSTKRIIKVFEHSNIEFFLTEKKILQEYKIINFPNLISSESIDGEHLLVMEFIDGVNIFEKVSNEGCMKRTEAVGIIKRIIDAVLRFYSICNGKYILCDISPKNIILRNDGEISIVDLNGARERGEAFKSATIGFAADESFREECVSEKADIYSIGRLFCFMLTGKTDIDNKKVLDKRDDDLISRCIVKRDFNELEELIGALSDKKKIKRSQILFKRSILVVGSPEFALELTYSLKNLGYFVRFNHDAVDSKLLNYYFKYNNCEDICDVKNPDIEIVCLKHTHDLETLGFNKVLYTLDAYTYELEALFEAELQSVMSICFVFYQYERSNMIPEDIIKKVLPKQKYFIVPKTRKRKQSYETAYSKYITGFRADKSFMKIIDQILGE